MKLNREALAVELPAKITAKWLKSLGACKVAVKIFRKRWPKGAPVSPATVRRAAKLKLNIRWLAQEIVTPSTMKVYREATAPAWKVCQETVAPAWKAYQETVAQAQAVYREATAQAVYRETTAQARKVYRAVVAQAWAVYWEATAQALIKILWK